MTETNNFVPTRENLNSYDKIIVMFSGGKDSLACVADLLDRGASKSRIELWHHEIDGREGSTLMDWPCTADYCKKVAAALGLPIYFSWKVGGFEREMLRDQSLTAPTAFESPEGLQFTGGDRGKPNTRRQFPQVSPDLSVRWCSAYLKIDVGSTAIRNQPRFQNSKTLVVTGERAEESSSRAKYATFEPDRTDLRNGKTPRHVDHWRPVHGWSEAQVWEAIQRHGIVPHPAYYLGWGRVSCAACIFGSPNQWASLRAINPGQFNAVAAHEASFGKTIKRKLNVIQVADSGAPYQMEPHHVKAALSTTFDQTVIVPSVEWKLPAGAFGESCGPV